MIITEFSDRVMVAVEHYLILSYLSESGQTKKQNKPKQKTVA